MNLLLEINPLSEELKGLVIVKTPSIKAVNTPAFVSVSDPSLMIYGEVQGYLLRNEAFYLSCGSKYRKKFDPNNGYAFRPYRPGYRAFQDEGLSRLVDWELDEQKSSNSWEAYTIRFLTEIKDRKTFPFRADEKEISDLIKQGESWLK